MNGFWLGVVSGVPLMVSVGPIAVLLVELGIGQGFRRAWPAAIGVATADLTFATIAALSGAGLQRALHPYATAMRVFAAAALLLMAAVMLRRAIGELRATRAGASVADGTSAATPTVRADARLAPRMLALTLMNPMTIVAFTTLVLATGERASNLGWPLGIAAASATVHLLLVGFGSSFRRALPPLGAIWFRVAGSLLICGLAANLVLHQ